ncbi:MAG TPA: outer membrane protein assembly factor BamD [Acidobacteriaceae bacterium]|jgi:hypothetical protein|nr:outer membrane protein assembly factor BamD [Acidobacteriaceae bacterium]
MRIQSSLLVALFLVPAVLPCAAQQPQKPSAPPGKSYGEQMGPYATVLTQTTLYVQPDNTSTPVTVVEPGREMNISERNGPWLRVFANTDVNQEPSDDQPVFGNPGTLPPASGWIQDKGVISDQTTNGAMLLFGAASDAEHEASEPHPPAHAAKNAQRLYQRVAEFFPTSPLAPEAQWRAADIQWQLDKEDNSTLPSAHEKAYYLRPQINDSAMHKLEHKYPHSKWADLAAWDMIDNKLCGAWQGSTDCPEREAAIYASYAHEHPDSPKLQEALWEAAWRLAVLKIEYTQNGDAKRAKQAGDRATDMAQTIETKFPGSDYAARATTLIYKMNNSLPVFGEDHD